MFTSIKLTPFKTIFGCDLRTLALFRISLGLVVLADVLLRAQYLSAHYTDDGILPRADILPSLNYWYFSLHLINGSWLFQALLFTIAGIAAVALIFGYRTRVATLISWVLIISVQNRNPVLLQGGDVLVALLLFWGMFLPLGARFSVDAALNPNPPRSDRYFSIATMALLIQCISVYFFTALLKTGADWLPNGTAVYYALHLDAFATLPAQWLRQYPLLTQPLTYFVWFLEILAPFLIFSPLFHLPLRLATMGLLIGMHLGFFTFLEIGLFPFISITSLLAFTPSWVWDRLETIVRTPERRGIVMYYDQDCGFCKKVCLLLRTFLLLKDTPIRPAQETPEIGKILEQYNSWVVTDHTGKTYIRWDAIVLVFRRSLIFWPLGYLFGTRPLRAIGDKIYYLIGDNRDTLGAVTARLLPYRPVKLTLSDTSVIIVTVLLVYITYMNIRSVPNSPLHGLIDPLPRVNNVLRLYQNWDMFAPYPARSDGWFVIRGELEDGSVVDVARHTPGEPSWEQPDIFEHYHSYYRWRKYMMRLPTKRWGKHLLPYGRYWCRQWNRQAEKGKRLATFKVYYNQLTTQPDFQPRKLTKRMVWHHWCFEKPKTEDKTVAATKPG